MKVLAMMIAGGFGTLARYLVGLAFKNWFGATSSSFPMATLVINVLGSFVLSWIAFTALQNRISDDWKLILGTGFCGAFTTFSTFELETHALFVKGANLEGVIYVFGNLVLGFLAVLLGIFVARGFSSS
jgi:fluoride exporter